MQNLQIHHGDSALLCFINLIQNLLHIHHGELVLFITFGKPHAKASDTSRRFDFITFVKPHRKPQIHHGESGPYLLRLVNLIENFQVYYGESVLFYTLGKPITKLPHILLLFLAAVE